MITNARPASIRGADGSFNRSHIRWRDGRILPRHHVKSTPKKQCSIKPACCDQCAREKLRLATHVVCQGGDAIRICLPCLRKLRVEKPRKSDRQAFAALFVRRPSLSGAGGDSVIVLLSGRTVEGRAA